MANFPFAHYQLPSCDAIVYHVFQIENGYEIRKYYETILSGSIREIAKALILDYINGTISQKGFYWNGMRVNLKPNIHIEESPLPGYQLITQKAPIFLKELTTELESLKKLIPFS